MPSTIVLRDANEMIGLSHGRSHLSLLHLTILISVHVLTKYTSGLTYRSLLCNLLIDTRDLEGFCHYILFPTMPMNSPSSGPPSSIINALKFSSFINVSIS